MERSKENEAEVVKEYKYNTEYQPGWEEALRRCLWMQEIAKSGRSWSPVPLQQTRQLKKNTHQCSNYGGDTADVTNYYEDFEKDP